MRVRRLSRWFGRVCAAALLGGSTLAALAAPTPVCRRSSEALVVSRERLSSVGEDIYVRRRPGPAGDRVCAFAPHPADWFVGRGEPVFVLAFEGATLALDRGTGPDRKLLIYNVISRRRIVSVPYDDGEGRFSATADAMTFWKIEPGAVKPETCPAAWRAAPDNKDAKRAHRTREMRLTLADGRVTPTGATGCRQTQDDVD